MVLFKLQMLLIKALLLINLCTFSDQESFYSPTDSLTHHELQANVIPYVPRPDLTDIQSKPEYKYGNNWEQFEVKHSYPKQDGKVVSSFDDLTSGEKGKDHMLKLHLQLVSKREMILPSATTAELLESQMKKVVGKKITIIDADILTLRDDVSTMYAEYLVNDIKLQPNDKGVLEIKNLDKDQRKMLYDGKKNFVTNKKYACTLISYELEDGILKVYAQQFQDNVKLGLREDGLPVHVEGLEKHNFKGEKIEIASFTKDNLVDINTETELIRNQLKVKKGGKQGKVINPNYKDFSVKHEEFLSNLKNKEILEKTYESDGTVSCGPTARSTRATGSACAIILNSKGEVVEVNPKKFTDAYQEANEMKKREMAEMVKDNRHKIESIPDDADAKNMWDLVKYEDLRTQATKTTDVEKAHRLPSDLPNHSDTVSSEIVKTVDDYHKSIQKLDSDVKISPSKAATKLTALTSTKQYKKFAKGVSKVSNVLGKVFMAKSVVTGIIHVDETSLAIIGGRIGYEVVTESAVKVGSKYFKQTSKIGSAAKTVGEFAGPVGDVIDVGLSTYAIAKSIMDLKNATNKYEKFDAIANIISNSIDIIVTATLSVLSIAFPPFAPVFVAVGLLLDLLNQIGMALFGAANAVASINAEIPLSQHEKNEVFRSRFFDMFGTRKKDYIDYMVAEKKANDMAVQRALKFLEENQEIRGIVFPSMTLNADGDCTFYTQHCRAKVAWGCLAGQWEEKHESARKCEYKRPCTKNGDICVDHYKLIGNSGYDQYTCECGSSKVEMNFDTPRKNSHVDFRGTQRVFLDRAVPKDVENGAFICKPGSKTYLTHRVSQDNPVSAYLCENAIGILQPQYRLKEGQIMLFQLEDGNDSVYLPTNYYFPPSLFIMGNEGYKHFEGGSKRNDFVFSSNCSGSIGGYIRGGPDLDSISLGEYCSRGFSVTVDCQQGIIRSAGAKLNVRFDYIEEIVGRKGQKDLVTAACTTRQIVGLGGLNNQPDEIFTLENPNCKHNLTIVTPAYTRIISKAKYGDIIIPVTGQPTEIDISFDAYSAMQLNNIIVFLNASSSQTKLSKFLNSTEHIELNLLFDSGKAKITSNFKANSDQQISILFDEKPEGSPYSVLFATVSGEKLFYHSLPHLYGVLSRMGSSNLMNMFDIHGNGWRVVGGNLDDEFVLHTNRFAFIDGKEGTDTLKIHPDINDNFMINLAAEEIKSIERLIGAAGKPITVYTSCDTEFVATQGGSSTIPDVVHVSNLNCVHKNVNTQILASGPTEVKIDSNLTGNNNVNVFLDGTTNDKLKFELEANTKFTENLLVNILLNHTFWKIKSSDCFKSQQAVILELEETSGNGSIKFLLNSNLDDENSQTLNIPYIQMSKIGLSPGVMVMNQETCLPKLYFNIADSGDFMVIHGFDGIENVFRLASSKSDVRVFGGSKNDLFIITPAPSDTNFYVFYGGENGTNSLVVEKNESLFTSDILSNTTTDYLSNPFLIDLYSNETRFLYGNSSYLGYVSSIHHVIGREDTPDIINASCETKSIDGRGGFTNKYIDFVQISDNRSSCIMNLMVTVQKFTNVKNTLPKGNFVYFVNDMTTSSMDILTTTKNSHHIQFNLDPWKFITDVTFDIRSNKLHWMAKNGNNSNVQSFQMVKSKPTEHYNNPVLQFGIPETSVSSEISVENDGTTVATFVIREQMYSEAIQGLPVNLNKFLVNVTKFSSSSNGIIHGCAHNCQANQFFLLNLESSLELLEGGKCIYNGCTNLLYLANTFASDMVEVNLDIANGYIKDVKGKRHISKLQNINELHGNENTTVVASCDTKQISGAGKVFIRQQNCTVNLIVGLEEFTEIWFLEQNRTIAETNSTTNENIVNYRFSLPMSFDPQGNLSLIQNYTHNYYWPFTLSAITELYFDAYENRLYYTINQIQYNHKMITFPDIIDQFYSQPNIVTADNFRIQIARDYSIWATWGENYSMYTPTDRPELESLANKLGVTIIIQTPKDFMLIGHSISDNAEDRNVLQNTENITSNLSGGGSENTIYEIVDLGYDVYIYTGFAEDNGTNTSGTYSESIRRQTIDLTDIVNPIRKVTDSKYLPNLRPVGDALVIEMSGHEYIFPGKIIIANGTKPWVSSRLQLLVGFSFMQLTDERQTSFSNETGNKQSVESKWSIRPRPIVVPDSIRIYSIAPEDLEDEQEIRLETSNTERTSLTRSHEKFEAARKGNDLHLTNLVNMGDLGSKSVLITGFYEKMPVSNDTSSVINSTGPNLIKSVRVALPGLIVLINETTLWKIRSNTVMSNETEWVVSLERVYERAERKLLQNFPKLPRLFQENTSNIGTTIVVLGCTFLLLLVVVATSYTLCTLRNRGELPLLKILRRYKENKELQKYVHK